MRKPTPPARRAWIAWIALLLPFCGPARAYDIFSDPPAGRFAINLDLGTAPVATSGYGITTWNALAQNALNAWNQTGIGPQQDHNFFSIRTPSVSGNACSPDGVSEVRFASTICGLAFGSALAVTFNRSPSGTPRAESDVVFDSGRTWNAYSGPLQAGIQDFNRVALHEFGHIVGLDHPDEAGQTKTALMNSHISNIDSLQADDIDGAHHVNWIWFAFPTQSGVALNAAVASNTITVTGLSAPATIGITGGEYSINGGSYTSAPGTVSGGQSVTLRVTASRAPMTAVTATLSIGAAAGDFTAITTAGGTPITVSASSYFPLIDNSSKTYLKNGTEVIVETVLPGTTLVNGVATKAVQSSDGETSYGTNDANGIREHRQFKSNLYVPG
ncbi:MAG TPA: matrixin family metalloprotease, partial [Burkholderiales bacterium]